MLKSSAGGLIWGSNKSTESIVLLIDLRSSRNLRIPASLAYLLLTGVMLTTGSGGAGGGVGVYLKADLRRERPTEIPIIKISRRLITATAITTGKKPFGLGAIGVGIMVAVLGGCGDMGADSGAGEEGI